MYWYTYLSDRSSLNQIAVYAWFLFSYHFQLYKYEEVIITLRLRILKINFLNKICHKHELSYLWFPEFHRHLEKLVSPTSVCFPWNWGTSSTFSTSPAARNETKRSLRLYSANSNRLNFENITNRYLVFSHKKFDIFCMHEFATSQRRHFGCLNNLVNTIWMFLVFFFSFQFFKHRTRH